MSDAFLAEIRIVACNFAPKGWAFCDGQIFPLSQNTALFALLGTTYGGDGKTTFALPNLQGRAPMHPGQGPGLSLHNLGEQGGSATVTLAQTEMPAHAHTVGADSGGATVQTAAGSMWAGNGRRPATYDSSAPNTQMNSSALGVTGGNQPHNNMQPYLGLNFIIALQGVFPARS